LNCYQARALLAIYRELKSNQEEYVALESHLSECQTCQQVHDTYQRMARKMQDLPPVLPPPDAHTKLMQALAVEHVRFIQRTHSNSASTPTPGFLFPFVQNLGKLSTPTSNLAAFSTAETGPLPSIQKSRAHHRHSHHMRHLAIVGIAASFLMFLMIGGLSTLLLNSSTIQPLSNPVIVNPARDIQYTNFTTNSTFPSVASATVSGNSIFYTSYNAQATLWDLEQFDKTTQKSTSLLHAPDSNELFILTASSQWLIWLQIAPPTLTHNTSPQGSSPSATPTFTTQPIATTTPNAQPTSVENPHRSWTLYATYIGSPLTLPIENSLTIPVLSKQVFHSATVPHWINRPIQGVWLNESKLYVTMINTKGRSQLLNFDIEQGKIPQASTIATAPNGHILISPTASSDNQHIYWGEEWLSEQNMLQSNIWSRQQITAPALVGDNAKTQTHSITPLLFLSDGLSFHPQMVADHLFILNTNLQDNSSLPTPTVSATPTSTASATTIAASPTTIGTSTPTPTPTPVNPSTFLGGSQTIDPYVWTPQMDDGIVGKIQAFTASGNPEALPLLDGKRLVSSVQGGTRYLLWQNSAKVFEMYDVIGKYYVNVGSATIPYDAAFLTITGTTGIWVENNSATNRTTGTVIFNTFNWPWPRDPSLNPSHN
jgi:hypothetical protein